MANVLVIEDDNAVRMSLRSALQSMGHTVDAAANGFDGVVKFDQGVFDLVITDLVMPEKDGVETILELRLKAPDLKIVAISGGGQHLDFMESTQQIGADCALVKPFSINDLRDCLRRVLPYLSVV